MAKLVSAECPHCGAKLKVDPGQRTATCAYCDTTSTVEGRPRPRSGAEPSPRVIYVERSGSRGVLGVVGLVVAGLVAGFFVLRPGASSSSGGTTVASPPTSPPPPLVSEETDTFTGRWTIADSTNPSGGGGYAGVVDVTKSGAVYRLLWHIHGTPPYRGVGVAIGEGLAVGWGVGAEYGVAAYEIAGGRLQGTWATESSGRTVGSETLVGPESLEGTFEIEDGRGPNGDSYGGQVAIARRGETFVFRWKIGGDRDAARASYTGVGIRKGDELVVGWGAEGSGSGVVVYETSDAGLAGTWSHPDASTVGTENLRR